MNGTRYQKLTTRYRHGPFLSLSAGYERVPTPSGCYQPVIIVTTGIKNGIGEGEGSALDLVSFLLG